VDLACAHVAALAKASGGVSVYNLGTGRGHSVLEMLKAFEQASGRTIPYTVAARRAGDLPAFWANPAKAERELGWKAERSLEQMCADTWRWQSANPDGYRTERAAAAR
jgi:UDP-glucose 4-epimerase